MYKKKTFSAILILALLILTSEAFGLFGGFPEAEGLDVHDIVADPFAYFGEITIRGGVKDVDGDKKLFNVVDYKEYRSCRSVSCWKLILRNLTRRKSRFVFTLSAIAVGIASVVALLSMGTGLETEIRKQADVLGAHLVVTPKGWCAYEQISVLTGESLPEALPAEDVAKIAAIKGLRSVPFLTQRAVLKNRPVPLVGILPESMKKFKNWPLNRGNYVLANRAL